MCLHVYPVAILPCMEIYVLPFMIHVFAVLVLLLKYFIDLMLNCILSIVLRVNVESFCTVFRLTSSIRMNLFKIRKG